MSNLTNLFNGWFNNFDFNLDSLINKFDESKLDFSKKEDLDKFNKACDEISNNKFLSSMLSTFDISIDDIKKAAQEKYDEAHKDDDVKEETIIKPSTQISDQAGLKLHKLVTEYVDTMIRPYATNVDKNVINDAYAGLYEFACWIYNK